MTSWPAWPVVQAIETDDTDADPEGFRLIEPYRYEWTKDAASYRITVPAGFVYNEASVPRVAWVLVSPLDLGPGSALIHDYLYNWQGELPRATVEDRVSGRDWWWPVPDRWTRKSADRLLGRMMRESGVAKWRRRMAYRCVRLFGRGAWNRGKRGGYDGS